MDTLLRSFAGLAACTGLLLAQNTGIALTNGVDGYLEVPYAAALVPQSGITFEAWITYDDATLGAGWRYPTVCRQNIAPGQEAFFLRVNAGNSGARTLTWKVVTSSGAGLNCNWAFAPGQLTTWTHVAGTYDGTTATLVVNGQQVASATGNGLPVWDRGGTLRIGKGDDSGGPIEVWNGEIDEVRLWPFARSAAAIQQAMNFELQAVPGLVSTWNLNGAPTDSSGGLHATASGTVGYQANPLNLTLLPAPSGFAAGTSTPGCLGPVRAAFGSLPQAGNLDFTAHATRVPANAATFFAAAFQTTSAPLPIAGIAYWLDLGSTVVTLTSANALGAVRVPIGFPAALPPGFTLAYQFGCLDPCGPQGLTASDALLVVTQ